MKRPLLIPAVCFVSGAVMLFTPVRFCGGLIIAAGLVFCVFWAIGRLRSACLVRALRGFLAVLLVLGLIVFCIAEAFVISMSKTDDSTPVSAVIILGAGVYGETPSLSLRVRLQAALDYVQDKPDTPIVVSGGQGPGEDISEARAMADWLIAHGIDEDRIILEDKSTSTQENLRYSLEILGHLGIDASDGIAVVSADYHLCRAGLLFPGDGMVPVAAHMPLRFWPLTVNYFIREAFGVVYLWTFA